MNKSFRIRSCCAAVALLALAGVPSLEAAEEPSLEQELQMVRALSEAQRQTTVAANVQLTEAEAQAFWPVYRDYRNEVLRVNDKAIAVLQDFAKSFDSMSDDKAKVLTRDWLDVEKSRLTLKEKYLKKFDKVLPAAKVARAMQVELKLDAFQQVGLARTVPLIQP